MKILPVGAELFHDGTGRRTDGRTHMTQLVVAFLYFVKELKNCPFYPHCIIVLRLSENKQLL